MEKQDSSVGVQPVSIEHAVPIQNATVEIKPGGNFRWVICGLIFFGTTLNYVDRQVLSLLKPQLTTDYHITDFQYGIIAACFSFCYAMGQLVAGGWLDRVGNRIGYAWALGLWSLASMGHALAKGPLGFGIARAFLGVSESPAYPAATKVLAEWFPKKERSLGMGIVNAGSNLGALLVPIVIPWIVTKWGIGEAFFFTGSAGLLFLLLWIPIYKKPEDHPMLSKEELAYIRSDPPESTAKIPWKSLWPFAQTKSFVVSKFITDSMWGFLIFFSTDFLANRFKLKLTMVAKPVIVIWLLADVGSIGGGWISSYLIKKGRTTSYARKSAMFVCALFVLPVMYAPFTNNMWTAALLIGTAMAAHQGFSANQYTLVSDMFPRAAVASVAGMGGSAGYFGATIMSFTTGLILKLTHGSYVLPFAVASVSYLFALAIIHHFAPRLDPIQMPGASNPADLESLLKTCPACAQRLAPDAKHCNKCGSPLPL